jgi:hypothetical protein
MADVISALSPHPATSGGSPGVDDTCPMPAVTGGAGEPPADPVQRDARALAVLVELSREHDAAALLPAARVEHIPPAAEPSPLAAEAADAPDDVAAQTAHVIRVVGELRRLDAERREALGPLLRYQFQRLAEVSARPAEWVEPVAEADDPLGHPPVHARAAQP